MSFLRRLFGGRPVQPTEVNETQPSGGQLGAPEDPPWRTAGLIRGKHYSAYVEEIDNLLREGKLPNAQALLLECIDATEAESAALGGGGVAPVYYGALARLYSDQHRADDEFAVLQRYAAQAGAMRNQKPDQTLLFRLAELERGQTEASTERLDGLLTDTEGAFVPYSSVVQAAKTYFDAGERTKATETLQQLISTAERRNHASHWMYWEWGQFLLGKNLLWEALEVFIRGLAAHGAPSGFRTRNRELWGALAEVLKALGVQNVNPVRRAVVEAMKTAGVDEAISAARQVVDPVLAGPE